jgi:hypothetical protein
MDPRWAELARTLRDLGMWRHLPEEAEREVSSGEFPFKLRLETQGVSWFFVDGETMAEAAVGRELQSLAPPCRLSSPSTPAPTFAAG